MEISFKRNVGLVDRAVRIFLSILLVYIGIHRFLPGGLITSTILFVLAANALFVGITGY